MLNAHKTLKTANLKYTKHTNIQNSWTIYKNGSLLQKLDRLFADD